MINIRSAKQMDLARIETIYNYIHDEEVGISGGKAQPVFVINGIG